MKHTKRFLTGIISGAIAFSIAPVIAAEAEQEGTFDRAKRAVEEGESVSNAPYPSKTYPQSIQGERPDLLEAMGEERATEVTTTIPDPLDRPGFGADQGLPREGSMEQVQQERSRFAEAAPTDRFREQGEANEAAELGRTAVSETDRVVVEPDGSLAAEASGEPDVDLEQRTQDQSRREMASSRSGEQINDSSAVKVVRAGDMLGWDVVDANGKKVGDLTDFAIRPGSNEVPYAVITSGGVLGIGGKDHLVELSSLQHIENEGHLRLSDSVALNGDTSASQQEGSLVHFFADMEGERVSGAEGEVGTVEDMLLHFRGGSMAYVIVDPRAVSFASGTWPTNYRAAIPAGLIQQGAGSGDITLDIRQNDLRDLDSAEDLEAIDLTQNSTARVYRINVDALERAGMAQADSR